MIYPAEDFIVEEKSIHGKAVRVVDKEVFVANGSSFKIHGIYPFRIYFENSRVGVSSAKV